MSKNDTFKGKGRTKLSENNTFEIGGGRTHAQPRFIYKDFPVFLFQDIVPDIWRKPWIVVFIKCLKNALFISESSEQQWTTNSEFLTESLIRGSLQWSESYILMILHSSPKEIKYLNIFTFTNNYNCKEYYNFTSVNHDS